MAKFELVNKNADEWTEAEFIDKLRNGKTYSSLWLVVDWGTKEAEVVPYFEGERADYDYVIDDSVSKFELESDVDFSDFKAFFNESVAPVLEIMDKDVERNWVEKEFVLNIKSGAIKQIDAWYHAIFNMLVAAPKHNLYYAWSFSDITDYYDEEGGFANFLEINGLDFRHVKLTEKISAGVVAHLLRDDVMIIMPFSEFVRELEKYQASYY